MAMTIDDAIKFFEESLKDGKCSETCESCNANELALEALYFRKSQTDYSKQMFGGKQ